ncbi:Carbonic anhydrase (fragment) [Carnobacterium maltaromaticum]|uniref:carbonic anhydrase family protein n=1 Tax=Carnobacterium maltaromaticum TaxID=2751 RepID=UPI0019EEEC3F
MSDSITTSQLFPVDLSYYHYLGSLTTPPLIENVEWYVMEYPVEVSQEQLKIFNTYYKDNNR